MVEKSPKLLWGAVAIAIYFLVVGLLITYFNTHNTEKSKHYVKKDEKRIQVALATPKKNKVVKQKLKPKKIVKPKVKPKAKPKKTKPIKKDRKKKLIKEKIVKKLPKKKKDENVTNPKKVKKKNTIDLFSNVKTTKKKIAIKVSNTPVKKKQKKNLSKVTNTVPSALEKIKQSLKDQKNMNTGVENAYFARVQRILEAWPAKSEFLGEEAKVTLYIKPTGKFEYQVTSGSTNIAFGESIIDFLDQLKNMGLGSHDAGRTYEFEVEFSTKE